MNKKEYDDYLLEIEKYSQNIKKRDIMECRTMSDMKERMSHFMNYVNGIEDEDFKAIVCMELLERVLKFSVPYFLPTDKNKNVVIIPPDHAPIYLLTTCVKITDDINIIMEGLNKFLLRCNEFEPPITQAVTEDEINLALDIAQREYGLLKIIAPQDPLKIIRLDNSNCNVNSECGITNRNGKIESILLIYSPKEADVVDNVFIFAHELGHALHLALTQDVNILPHGFDKFNENLNINHPENEKKEAFADVFAFTLLGADELQEHLPAGFDKRLLPYFNRYIKGLIQEYLAAR